MIVRDATDADLAAITSIQNALLATTAIEWRDEPHTVEERGRWLAAQREAGDPVLVADVDGAVVGFAAYGPFRDIVKWPGYRLTVENTIHVREDQWGTGVGRLLMLELIERARAVGKHVMIAAVDGENEGSIAFHRKLGFSPGVVLHQVGTKHGRWLDLVLLELQLDRSGPP